MVDIHQWNTLVYNLIALMVTELYCCYTQLYNLNIHLNVLLLQKYTHEGSPPFLHGAISLCPPVQKTAPGPPLPAPMHSYGPGIGGYLSTSREALKAFASSLVCKL